MIKCTKSGCLNLRLLKVTKVCIYTTKSIEATDMTAVMDYRLRAADGFIMNAGKNFDITQQHCCNLL